MFSLIAKFAPKVLPFLGKLWKGKATIVGDVVAATGIAVVTGSGHVVTDQNIVPILHEVGLILTALGGLISAFGFGRKAAQA